MTLLVGNDAQNQLSACDRSACAYAGNDPDITALTDHWMISWFMLPPANRLKPP
ncbi:hypothetical protein WP1_062 [Pseudomonas phage WP1]